MSILAQDSGVFKAEITPVQVKGKKGMYQIVTDSCTCTSVG